jgi:hypothetical protein
LVDWLNKLYNPDNAALAVASDLNTVSEVISLTGASISMSFSHDGKPAAISIRNIDEMIYAFIINKL